MSKNLVYLGRDPGIYLFGSGRSWETAYAEAVNFAAELAYVAVDNSQNSILCLGPKIGDAGRGYLLRNLHAQSSVVFGKFLFHWHQWISDRVRALYIQKGMPYRELNLCAKRDLFRGLLSGLDDAGLFVSLSKVWKDPRFFSHLLEVVEEFRTAGMCDELAISVVQEKLKEKAGDNSTVASEELWMLLLAWERSLGAMGENVFVDVASKLRALESDSFEDVQALYLIGFDKFSLMEIELLQRISQNVAVFLPIPLDSSLIDNVLQGLASSDTEEFEGMTLRSLMHLSTNFSGTLVNISKEKKERVPKSLPILISHTAQEEWDGAFEMLEYCGEKNVRMQLCLSPTLKKKWPFPCAA